MSKYKVGQILEEVKSFSDEDRDPEYFEVIRIYDPPMKILFNHLIYADIEDSRGNIIQLDDVYEIFIKPVEEAW